VWSFGSIAIIEIIDFSVMLVHSHRVNEVLKKNNFRREAEKQREREKKKRIAKTLQDSFCISY
jgi:hypothetical protein